VKQERQTLDQYVLSNPTMTNVEIGKMFGLSHGAIRDAKIRLGVPSLHAGKQSKGNQYKDFIVAHPDLSTYQICAELGGVISRSSIVRIRTMLKKDPGHDFKFSSGGRKKTPEKVVEMCTYNVEKASEMLEIEGYGDELKMREVMRLCGVLPQQNRYISESKYGSTALTCIIKELRELCRQ